MKVKTYRYEHPSEYSKSKSSNRRSLQEIADDVINDSDELLETSIYFDDHGFDPEIWREVGIYNPDSINTEMPLLAMSIQKKEMLSLYWIIVYLFFAFVFPWSTIRLFY